MRAYLEKAIHVMKDIAYGIDSAHAIMHGLTPRKRDVRADSSDLDVALAKLMNEIEVAQPRGDDGQGADSHTEKSKDHNAGL